MSDSYVPGFWKNETGGVLQPAVMAYLRDEDLTSPQIAAIRAYLRQWMQGDWRGPLVDVLRTKVDELNSKRDIRRWLDLADQIAIDPL